MIWKQLYVTLWTFWLKCNYGWRYTMMAKIYFNRLVIGTITFDAIPAKYQDRVREYGVDWVKVGRMTIEEYEMLYKEEYPEA